MPKTRTNRPRRRHCRDGFETQACYQSWQTTKAWLWEDARNIATPVLVAAAVQYRANFELARTGQMNRSTSRMLKMISVPIDDVMKNFRYQPQSKTRVGCKPACVFFTFGRIALLLNA